MSAHDPVAVALDWLGGRYSVGPKHLGPPRRRSMNGSGQQPWPIVPPLMVSCAPSTSCVLPTRTVLVWRRCSKPQHGEAAAAAARERASNAPALVAVSVRPQTSVDDVPEHEQWLSADAAMMHFLNAMHLTGYAAKVLSGASVPTRTSVRCSATTTSNARPGS